MQDHVPGPRQAFDFGDELTIGGRDAVSSSSAVVSDRLGSLSYHKPDHPTLNAAAALGPTSTPRQLPCCCAGTERAECRPCYFPLLTDGRTQIALWEKGCYVRGRSSGKTGPPGTTGFTAVRGGAKIGGVNGGMSCSKGKPGRPGGACVNIRSASGVW